MRAPAPTASTAEVAVRPSPAKRVAISSMDSFLVLLSVASSNTNWSPEATAAAATSEASRARTPEAAARPLPAIAVMRSATDSTLVSPVAPPSRNRKWSSATATAAAASRPGPSLKRLSTPIFFRTPPSLIIISSAAASPSEANSA